jgi:uncharacterized protein
MRTIRTVTLGIDPDASSHEEVEARARRLFGCATERICAAGRRLRTRRLLLPVLNGRPRFSRANLHALLRWVVTLGEACEARWFNVPFTTFVEGPLEPSFEAALEVIRRFPRAFVNIIVAEEGRISRTGALATAGFIKSVASQSPNGYDNFRVGASCNCPAGGPFFPFTYHDGPDAFSMALELPALFSSVLDACAPRSPEAARDVLIAAAIEELREVDGLGREIEAESGVPYRGLDASLAPYPDATGSVARIIERLGVDDYGSSGTLLVTALLTEVLRESVAQSGARGVGFHGVMDSLLEDPAIAVRASQSVISVDSLLAFAAICGCGLDMVPLPGDTYREEIAAMILDVAALSCALQKPLGVRLLPIPGRHAHQLTDFGHDFIYNCRILPVRNRAFSAEFFGHAEPLVLAPRRPKADG